MSVTAPRRAGAANFKEQIDQRDQREHDLRTDPAFKSQFFDGDRHHSASAAAELGFDLSIHCAYEEREP